MHRGNNETERSKGTAGETAEIELLFQKNKCKKNCYDRTCVDVDAGFDGSDDFHSIVP